MAKKLARIFHKIVDESRRTGVPEVVLQARSIAVAMVRNRKAASGAHEQASRRKMQSDISITPYLYAIIHWYNFSFPRQKHVLHEKCGLISPSSPVATTEKKGFVLVTALVLLMLLSMLASGVMFSGLVSVQTSQTARDSTMAFYYAETGMHYMAWALNNDAEFDSYAPIVQRTSGVFAEPALPASPAPSTIGDRSELFANLLNPGPTAISDTSGAGTSGQIMYLDNMPVANRALKWPLPTDAGGNQILPVLSNISVSLPRYIKLEIDTNGIITPQIPALPHANPPVAGTDIPNNGAIIWITAGDTIEDAEIYTPLDPNNVNASCEGDGNCPCRTGAPSPPAAPYQPGQSCYITASGVASWVYTYSLVAYSIGYVNGKAFRIVRAVIM